MERDETNLFLDHINKNNLPWALQTAQNVLSVFRFIPLRLYNFSNAEKIWERFKNNKPSAWEEFKNYEKDPFQGLIKLREEANKKNGEDCLLTYFNIRKNSPWVTRASYTHPLIADFRLNTCFRTLEQVLFYTWISELKEKNLDHMVAHYLEYFLVGIKQIQIMGIDFIVTVGPVFRSPSVNTGGAFQEEILDGFLSRISKVNFIDPKDQDQLKAIKDKVPFLGSMRPWWSEEDIACDLHRITSSYETLLNTRFHADLTLRRCICRSIALASWVLNSKKYQPVRNKPYAFQLNRWEKIPNKKSRIYIPVDSNALEKYQLISYWSEKWILELLQAGRHTEDGSKLYVKSDNQGENLFSSIYNRVTKNKRINLIKDFEETLNRYYRTSFARLVSTEETYSQERIVLLFNKLRQRFGLMPLQLSRDRKGYLQYLCNRVAEEIVSLLNSDICNVYIYNYSTEVVKLVGYYIDERDQDKKTQLFKILSSVESIKPDDAQRTQSMNYRVIRNRKESFCRAVKVDGDNYRFDPDGEELIHDFCKVLKCGISIPLEVNNRVLGVLGVSGFAPYQFRKQNVLLLRRFAKMITPYLYQALLMYKLGVLMDNTLDPQIDDIQKYHKVCQVFSEIFLAYSAVFWTQDKNRMNSIKPKGWCDNRSELERLKKENPKGLSINIKDESSLFYNINSEEMLKKRYTNFPIWKKYGEDPDWFKKGYNRDWLKRNGIKSITIIPVKRLQNSEFVGVLTLYYKDQDEELEDTWKSILVFMADYLAIILDAIAVQTIIREHFNDILQHELKQKVDIIMLRVEDLYIHLPPALTNFKIGPVGSKSPVSRILDDIKSYASTLHKLVEKIQSKDLGDMERGSIADSYYNIIDKVVDEVKSEVVNFRNIYNETFRPTWTDRKDKEISESYDGPTQGPYLTIASIRLRDILSNLILNAVKYARQKSLIGLKVFVNKYTIEFHLSNIAKSLSSVEEEYSIFNDGVRGANAENIDGKGKGLGIARHYAEQYYGELTVDIRPEEDGYSAFTFILSFPKKIMLKEG
ncbi:GAF domain-containing sensor histidine kinase [Desulfosudis oleivorans]|uniref:Histidine kinase n=1 Tax=Desulfosudis oleivorans (strain DSM 6200 / JCM 39069 / Hxd3) TaxID=96561 RepID=A8ZZS8_DESOH|nr:ATP-binding protein [Desulfosudis oleivorans]ABW68950.1 histidine kinase [Desulfosudis oleivorans Hxd3]